jgi:uncharacterized protein (TIGR00288 family)
MNPRLPRREPMRSTGALIHRGPQAAATQATQSAPTVVMHAPNAALLIDFDNVTMGIRSDLGKELRNLLSSDIIKGKVAVQRAYADWRRYAPYIVALTEASIDLIFAPAYGSAKKNATDIRLAVDAIELVFTRPEIGTFILLSGDSDFSSLVIKLKEYGKYVIGVGIRESSSDLLVMNCDEYYSYNALAGLVKAGDEETGARKYDPWELVTEAIQRMRRNGDVMRSDRLKQVMQEIDSTFDEKNTGYSKFSKFVQDAAARGLVTLTKLENGQLDVSAPGDGARPEPAGPGASTGARVEAGAEERTGSRRGRRGGRGRGRSGRPVDAAAPEAEAAATAMIPPPALDQPAAPAPVVHQVAARVHQQAHSHAESAVPVTAIASGEVGSEGERLTRDEAFDLVRRSVETLTTLDEAVRASAVRQRARELLGRDSESLSERNFTRILRDAHDADIIDLRRRGEDFDVSRAASAAPVADQLAQAAVAAAPVVAAVPAGPRLGMGPRGGGGRSGGGLGRAARLAPPPGLLSIGVVGVATPSAVVPAEPPPETRPRRAPRKSAPPVELAAEGAEPAGEAAAEKTPRARRGGRGRRKPKTEA